MLIENFLINVYEFVTYSFEEKGIQIGFLPMIEFIRSALSYDLSCQSFFCSELQNFKYFLYL